MAFSRQEYWNELPFPSPEGFPSPGKEPMEPLKSLALQAESLLLSHWGSPINILSIPKSLFMIELDTTKQLTHTHTQTYKSIYETQLLDYAVGKKRHYHLPRSQNSRK